MRSLILRSRGSNAVPVSGCAESYEPRLQHPVASGVGVVLHFERQDEWLGSAEYSAPSTVGSGLVGRSGFAVRVLTWNTKVRITVARPPTTARAHRVRGQDPHGGGPPAGDLPRRVPRILPAGASARPRSSRAAWAPVSCPTRPSESGCAEPGRTRLASTPLRSSWSVRAVQPAEKRGKTDARPACLGPDRHRHPAGGPLPLRHPRRARRGVVRTDVPRAGGARTVAPGPGGAGPGNGSRPSRPLSSQ